MEEKVYPPVTVVDENDNLIGYMGLFEAIALGHIRRVACVFVIDSQNQILIQRRAPNVLSPNLLDFSAAGHVNEGQSYEDTARNELEEELGIRDVPLKAILPPFYTPGFYNGLFVAHISSDNEIKLAAEEVSSVFWVLLSELQAMIVHHPQQFAEPFLAAWPHVCDKIIP